MAFCIPKLTSHKLQVDLSSAPSCGGALRAMPQAVVKQLLLLLLKQNPMKKMGKTHEKMEKKHEHPIKLYQPPILKCHEIPLERYKTVVMKCPRLGHRSKRFCVEESRCRCRIFFVLGAANLPPSGIVSD